VAETHLPNAFLPLRFAPFCPGVPHSVANPVGSPERAALHSLAAFVCALCASCASSAAFCLTHALKVVNFAWNASRVAWECPRNMLHSLFAARLSPAFGVGLAPA